MGSHYVLVILAAVIALAASGYCSSVMKRYSRIRLAGGETGAGTVQRVLHAAGIYDVALYPLSAMEAHFTGMTERSTSLLI